MRVLQARSIAVVGCALLCCACAAAQSRSWSAVRGIATGAPVEARLVNGAKVRGKFVAAYAAGIELRTSPDTQRYVPRVEIGKLYLYPGGKSAAGRDAWIGLAVGATVGASFGVVKALCPSDTYPSSSCRQHVGGAATEWGVAFGLIGAIAGDVAGGVHRPRTLLYWRRPGEVRRGRKAPVQNSTTTVAPANPAGSAGQKARSPRYAWAPVRGLAAGTRIEVRLASGAKINGKLVSVSAAGIDLRTPHTIWYIRRERIRTLALTGERHTVRDAAIGFGIGAVGGAAKAATSVHCYSYNGPGCTKVGAEVVWASIAGAAGAIAGALIGLVRSPRKVIYRFGGGGNDHAKTAQRGKAILTAAPAAASGPARN